MKPVYSVAPFSMHRSLWPGEKSETLKSIGLHTDSSPCKFDRDLTSSHISFENTCFGISESKEAEIHHIGHLRATHSERLSPQYISQKSTYSERRKQRFIFLAGFISFNKIFLH